MSQKDRSQVWKKNPLYPTTASWVLIAQPTHVTEMTFMANSLCIGIAVRSPLLDQVLQEQAQSTTHMYTKGGKQGGQSRIYFNNPGNNVLNDHGNNELRSGLNT